MKKSRILVVIAAMLLAASSLWAEEIREISLEIANPYETNQFPTTANVLTPGVEAKIRWKKEPERDDDYEHYFAIVDFTVKGKDTFVPDGAQLHIKLNSMPCGKINHLDTKRCAVWFDFYDWKKLGGIEMKKAVPFAGGNGTKENPYLIKTAAQLNSVRYELDKHYRLANDIDLSNWGNWLPIGASPTYMLSAVYEKGRTMAESGGAFTGTLDGAGHVISGMKIVIHDKNIPMEKMRQYRCYSLFAFVWGEGKDTASIKNLGMENCLIDLEFSDFNVPLANDYIQYPAMISTMVENTKIENCYSSGGKLSIRTDGKSSAWSCGGLFGTVSSSLIERCYNTSDIYARYTDSSLCTVSVGGIACSIGGAAEHKSVVRECYNSGNISIVFDRDRGETAATEIMELMKSYGIGSEESYEAMKNLDPMEQAMVYQLQINAMLQEIDPMEMTNKIMEASGAAVANAAGIVCYGGYDFLVRSCYNTGAISAINPCGIVGGQTKDITFDGAGTVENCYNIGKLEAVSYENKLNPYAGNGAESFDIMNPNAPHGRLPVIRNNGVNVVSGSEWVHSAKLGRKVLRAIPE